MNKIKGSGSEIPECAIYLKEYALWEGGYRGGDCGLFLGFNLGLFTSFLSLGLRRGLSIRGLLLGGGLSTGSILIRGLLLTGSSLRSFPSFHLPHRQSQSDPRAHGLVLRSHLA